MKIQAIVKIQATKSALTIQKKKKSKEDGDGDENVKRSKKAEENTRQTWGDGRGTSTTAC